MLIFLKATVIFKLNKAPVQKSASTVRKEFLKQLGPYEEVSKSHWHLQFFADFFINFQLLLETP